MKAIIVLGLQHARASFLGRGLDVPGRLFIRSLEAEARRTLFATVFADKLLAAHGAEAGDALVARKGRVRKRAGETNRRILSDVLGDSSRVSYCRGDFVAHDAGRGRILGETAGLARVEELALDFVFLGE